MFKCKTEKVIYSFLAALVMVMHFAFIVFVVMGGLLVLKRRWVAWLHIPAAVWGALIEFMGWICPLTPLENKFRMLAGESGYTGDFVARYLLPIIYPGALTREIQLLLGALVLIINVLVYAVVIRRWVRSRKAG